MSQDSEKNDQNAGRSRDGEPKRRDDRSTGRRDDAPNSRPRPNADSDRPRFSRDTDRPKFSRPADGDRPRFNRDDRKSGSPERKPFDRSNRPTGGSPDRSSRDSNSDSRPRFNRPDDRRSDSNSRPPRFERGSSDRPDFNRDNRSRDDKPRFDSDRPKFNRPADGDRPRFNRDDRKPGSGSSDRPNRPFRPDDKPRFERNDRTTERPDRRESSSPRSTDDRRSDRPNREERPRVNRDDRPRDGRSGGPSRFDRSDASGNKNRFNSTGKPSPSRFSRDDKPGFKRVGGFSREADERNNRSGTDDQRSTDRATPRDQESRFTSKQRKDSGDRRTGDFTKAPNYNLEQTRATDSFKRGRSESPRRGNSDGSDSPKRTSHERNDGPETTRLNRYIANSGVCSRREADELIAQGDISVNGKVVTEMGYKVKDGDTVKYGTKVLNPEKFVYVLLNKPKDYITTTEDPNERKTVMELVADAGNFRMYPVGRLDRNTTGLLLVTNDGELADKLTHPSNNIRKIYQVELDKPITDEHFEAIKNGIELEDGPIKPDAISIVTPDAYVVGVEIHSGRNRIVRRMFENFGYEVTKLDRTTYAGLTKKELPRGKWRFLDPKEVVKLKYFNS